uniref:Uncharacterized protein n=1 Tax=Heterosigma akashiwo TaxID=2829 RepID=A0A7S3UUY7_HETAK
MLFPSVWMLFLLLAASFLLGQKLISGFQLHHERKLSATNRQGNCLPLARKVYAKEPGKVPPFADVENLESGKGRLFEDLWRPNEDNQDIFNPEKESSFLPKMSIEVDQVVEELKRYKSRAVLLQDTLVRRMGQLKHANGIIDDLRQQVIALKNNPDMSQKLSELTDLLKEERVRFATIAQRLQAEVAALRRALKRYEEELDQKYEKDSEELTKAKETQAKLEEANRALADELRISMKARKGWDTRKENLQDKIDKFQTRNLLLENKIVELKEKMTSVLLRNAELEKNRDQAQAAGDGPDTGEVAGRSDFKEQALNITEKSLCLLEDKNIMLEQTNNVLKNQLEELQQDLKQKELKISNSEKDRDNAVLEKEALMAELRRLNQTGKLERQNIEKRIEALQLDKEEQLQKLNAKMQESEKRAKALETDTVIMEDLRQRILDLETTKQDQQGEIKVLLREAASAKQLIESQSKELVSLQVESARRLQQIDQLKESNAVESSANIPSLRTEFEESPPQMHPLMERSLPAMASAGQQEQTPAILRPEEKEQEEEVMKAGIVYSFFWRSVNYYDS